MTDPQSLLADFGGIQPTDGLLQNQALNNNINTLNTVGNGTTATGNSQENGQINSVNEKVKLPEFVEENTDLWFWQVDAQFEAAGLTPRGNTAQQNATDKKRYMTIIGQLPTRIMYKLSDLRENPPSAGTMYNTLKDRITKEFADSTQTKITKLLGEMSLGDRKPSQLLAEMRTKAANTPVTDQLLRELWQRSLPQEVRAILSAADNVSLAQSATQADRIMETIRAKSSHVHAIQPAAFPSYAPDTHQQPQYTAMYQQPYYGQTSTAPSQMMAPIQHQPAPAVEHLQQQLNKITQMFNEFIGRSRPQGNFSNRQRSQTPARQPQQQHGTTPSDGTSNNTAPPTSNQQPKFDTCWWHYKFGADARKCKPPCNFNASNSGKSPSVHHR